MLRDALYSPNEDYLMWPQFMEQLPERTTCRLMAGLLGSAGNGNYLLEPAQRLELLLDRRESPDPERLVTRGAGRLLEHSLPLR